MIPDAMGRTIFLALLLCCLPVLADDAVEARVIACYDGDTCTVDHDILPGRDRVRVRGADAPEMQAHCAAEKRLALAAKQFTTSRLVGRTVTCGRTSTRSGSTLMSPCRTGMTSWRRLSALDWPDPTMAGSGRAGVWISGGDRR